MNLNLAGCIFYLLFNTLVYLTVSDSNTSAVIFVRLAAVFYACMAIFYMSDDAERAITLEYNKGYYRDIEITLIITACLSIVLLLHSFVFTGTILLISKIITYLRIKEKITDIKKEDHQREKT